MKQKKQSVEKSKRSPLKQATTRPNPKPHLEVFAKAVAEGFSHVEAAKMCGRSPGSASYLINRPGVKERIAELETIAKKATEEAVTEKAIREIRKITIDRNDIIMGVVDCINDKTTDVGRLNVRMKGWALLADVYMLRAKSLQDLSNFYSWTSDELEAFAAEGTVPIRFRHLFGPGGPTGGLKPVQMQKDDKVIQFARTPGE